MLTQQELIDRLNQLTLRYNLTWFDIKYDADKAIAKINNFLGTKYPKLSDPNYMGSGPTGTYTFSFSQINENGTTTSNEYEIIKEEYFHSVIIPYIAMEVLSRDEEFTTIYNKYSTEMQEGLYDMFQKEFNKVPFEFRQNPDQGVFFGLDTAQGIIQHNERNLNIPTFKFRINYYPNDNDIQITNNFINDIKAYAYNEEATILYPSTTTKFYSTDGATSYTFASWSRDRIGTANIGATFTETPNTPTKVVMRSDLNLFANWTPVLTLTNSLSGVVNITATHRPNIINLVIPESIEGRQVITIPTDFVLANKPVAPNIDVFKGAIYLPRSVDVVSAEAFKGFEGTSIVLNEGLISIGAGAFANTPNLKEIIIPASVQTIAAGAFPVVAEKSLVIKVRVLQANKPAGWAGTIQVPTWYAANTSNYSVEIIWGYNGA